MASNDIKSTHDENPTGCDDVSSDYYFQVVKNVTNFIVRVWARKNIT